MAQATRGIGNWGRWGPQDERGALNLLTPEAVLAATRLCKTGKVYSLSIPMGGQNVPVVGARQPPQRFTVFNAADHDYWADRGRDDRPCIGEDFLTLSSHAVTHMDALSHVWADRKLYNGFSEDTVKTYRGAERCGIEKTRYIVGRAVMLDLPRYFGVEHLEPPRILTSAELLACAGRQGVEIRRGDILLVRTGWLTMFYKDKARWMGGQPGIGSDVCRLVKERDIAAVGSDNSTVEAVPWEDGVFLKSHLELIRNLGVPLLELLALDELAQDHVYECLLVVAPLVVKGAMGSPVNPIAIA